MRKNILNGKQIMNMEFQIDKTESLHFHQSIEILYVLEGEPEITVQDNTYQAHPEDIIVINANKKHSYQCETEVLLGCFEIDYRLLGDMLETDQLLFWCNSIVNKNSAYDDMRRVMKKIFGLYFEKGGQTRIIRESLYYQLLEILTENFFVQSGDRRFEGERSQNEERISEIVNYIHGNYRRKISLNELSEHLYLSVPYLSKYIKKQFGMNFLDYLNNIRLFHAVDDLLYSGESLTTIAMENGFANTAAFTEAFKKAYNMTPSEYRQQMTASQDKDADGERDRKKQLMEKKVTDYLDNRLVQEPVNISQEEAFSEIDTTVREEFDPYWKKMINLGCASDLLRSDTQEQVIIMQQELGFSYVRLWDVFGEEMMLNETSQEGEYYFGRLDKIFDFLTEHRIRPYLEMGYKPKALHRSLRKTIVMEKREIPFGGLESYERFIRAFITHIVNRYGLQEVEKWYFELWSGEDFENNSYNSDFFLIFGTLYRVLKKHSPLIRIGGGGIGIQYGSGNLAWIVENWKKQKYWPDFITLYCYPYVKGDEDGTAYAIQSTDRDFLKNQLAMADTVIRGSDLGDMEIHVSEWSSTISNRNILNDSCYKAAYLMKNIIDCFGKTNVLGYWLGSDIFAEHMDNRKLLFGGCGLLSIQGIKKPAFYSYRFLNMLGKYLVYKDENCIVTASDNNNYSIVCHNYRHLNYKYYLKAEDELEQDKLYQLFEDNQSRRLTYRFTGMKNGKYKIKTYSVSGDNGSAQEEMKEIGGDEALSRSEVEYLKRICTPRIRIRQQQAASHILNFEVKMKPQEIQFIHVSYLYE